MSSLRKIKEVADLNEKFKLMSLLYQRFLRDENVTVHAFDSPELPLFSALGPDQKQAVIDHMRSALEVFEEMRDEGQSLGDTPKLMWRALNKLGWVPQSDIFDKMGESDVVCFYSLEQKQIFQNLRFFDFVSLTLEQLYAAAWHIYSKRDPAAERLLAQHAIEVVSGRVNKTFDPGIPEHLCEEVGSAEMMKFLIKIRYMSPLKIKDKVCGALVINSCRLL